MTTSFEPMTTRTTTLLPGQQMPGKRLLFRDS
jgi:hypothetical protein